MNKHWVIPDIHGNAKTLKALVGDLIRPMRSDHLYFLGDYIDRGPDSRGVVDYIISLQNDGYNIRTLKGNHEDFLLKVYDNETVQKNFIGITYRNKLKKEWYKYGGRETLQSFGVSDVHQVPEHYIEWFRNLELYISLDSFLLVHAGLNFGIDDPFTDTYAMLWAKDFKVIPEKIENKKIIHGHVPVSLEFIDLQRTTNGFGFIDLDNGVYMDGKEGFGNLVALELTSMEMKVQPNIDL